MDRAGGSGRDRALVLAALVGCAGGDDGRGGTATFGGGTAPGSTGDATTNAGATDGSSDSDPDSTGDGSTSGPMTSGSESSGGPAFECDAAAADSPTLAGLVLFDPAEPSPGDTLTVIVRATNGLSRADAPPMTLQATSADGVVDHATQTIEGGEALYYYAIPDVPPGDICLLGLIDGQPEVASKVVVTPRPPDPPAEGGIYKITSNHQWTCDEEPDFGNELHVYVRDASGAPVPNQTISLQAADSTDPDTIYNDGPIPTEIVTDDSGHALAYNYWPISDNGLLVLKVAVAGVASDIATELTTGWWEDDLMGCNYCSTATVNVWGHWSYTVEFQLDPTATEICVVENDHAGMTACGEPRHIHHHPDYRPCWPPS